MNRFRITSSQSQRVLFAVVAAIATADTAGLRSLPANAAEALFVGNGCSALDDRQAAGAAAAAAATAARALPLVDNKISFAVFFRKAGTDAVLQLQEIGFNLFNLHRIVVRSSNRYPLRSWAQHYTRPRELGTNNSFAGQVPDLGGSCPGANSPG